MASFTVKAVLAILAVDAAGHRPPCRKAPSVRAVTLPSGKQAVTVGFGKGWYWEERKNQNGKAVKRKQIGYFGDVWAFDADYREWSYMEVNGHAATWNVSTEGLGGPSGRWKSEGTPVEGLGLVVFGGCTTLTGAGELNDLWVLQPTAGAQDGQAAGTWRRVETINSPPIRRGHVVETNSTHLVIFGGKTEGTVMVAGTLDVCTRDLWAIPLEALRPGADRQLATWTQGASFPGACRWGSTGTVIAKPGGGEVLALFGGRNLNPAAAWHSTDPNAYEYFGELWFYDFVADSWTLHQANGPSPQNRDHHAATLLGGDLWVFAGRISEERLKSANLQDLWRFSLATGNWTLESDGRGRGTPSRRYMPGITTIDHHGEEAIVMFGGEHLPGSTKKTCMNDVWLYEPGRGWSELLGTSCKKTPLLNLLEPSEASEARLAAEVAMPSGLSLGLAAATLGVATAVAARRRGAVPSEDGAGPFHTLAA